MPNRTSATRTLASHDTGSTLPLVALVGAGPGDPELLTLKAVDRLRRADVVVHDALATQDMLQRFAPQAEAIDATKHRGEVKMTQEQINETLVSLAQAGRRIVRLKGGDPCIFGRAQEERLALESAGIPYEIIPGVSSLSAVPASAGIIVTDRMVGRSVGAYSLHKREGQLLHQSEWQSMAAGPDTLILFMGRSLIQLACSKLIEFGRSPATPAALIVNGTRESQRAIYATLETLPARATAVVEDGPGLIVVGEVAGLPLRHSRPLE